MTESWQSAVGRRDKGEGSSGPRGQKAVESDGPWTTVSGRQFLGLGATLPPGSKGLGLAWLLEWVSDTKSMETKPSPLWGKG